MKNTESYFGLENHNGRITADAGKTYLPLYSEMTINEFDDLVSDIEIWREEELSESDIEDLKEILS